MTPEEIKRGMQKLRKWYYDLKVAPSKDSLVVLGLEEGDLTPEKLLETLEEREKNDDWDHDDFPQRVLEAIAK